MKLYKGKAFKKGGNKLGYEFYIKFNALFARGQHYDNTTYSHNTNIWNTAWNNNGTI